MGADSYRWRCRGYDGCAARIMAGVRMLFFFIPLANFLAAKKGSWLARVLARRKRLSGDLVVAHARRNLELRPGGPGFTPVSGSNAPSIHRLRPLSRAHVQTDPCPT